MSTYCILLYTTISLVIQIFSIFDKPFSMDKTTKTKDKDKPVPVRFGELKTYLREKAHKADRSMNWMVLHIVRKHKEREEGGIYIKL